MSSYSITVQPRKLFGRKVRSLRRSGMVPANVFGQKTESKAIQLNEKTFKDLYAKSGETGLINLTIEGETKARPVLVSGYAQDPVSSALLHVDFHQVDLKQKVTATIPLIFVGEAPASKEGLVVATMKNEVEVEALPTDLPENIEVDLSKMVAVGDSILASDLKIDKTKVELQIDETETIVSVQEQAKVEEPAPAEPAADSSAEASAKVEGEKPESEPAPAEAPKTA